MKPSDVLRHALLGALVLSTMLLPAVAGSEFHGARSGPAIEGYDPVAYQTNGAPLRGQANFAAEWGGATWWFESDANRQQFLAHPQRYAPQYGGHCALAMANGYFAAGDPQRWKVVDGKLYLNNNLIVHKLWQRDTAQKIADADNEWTGKRRELEAQP